jgi:hypothetical protein
MRAEAEAELAEQGLVAALTASLSRASADELKARARVEADRRRLVTGSIDAQIAVARAAVDQRNVRPGLAAVIDTRGGTVRGAGRARESCRPGGHVAVDITFGGAALPEGARPDLTGTA